MKPIIFWSELLNIPTKKEWNSRPDFSMLPGRVVTFLNHWKMQTTTFAASEPAIFEQMLEELPILPSNVRSILIWINRIAAVEKRSPPVLMKHALPQRSINTKNSKKEVRTFMVGDTPHASSTGSYFHKEHGSEFYLHFLDIMEDVLKLHKVFLLGSKSTADDL